MSSLRNECVIKLKGFSYGKSKNKLLWYEKSMSTNFTDDEEPKARSVKAISPMSSKYSVSNAK